MAQQCNSNDYIIQNNGESVFTISSVNNSCTCQSFVGDGTLLTNLQNNSAVSNLNSQLNYQQNLITNMQNNITQQQQLITNLISQMDILSGLSAAYNKILNQLFIFTFNYTSSFSICNSAQYFVAINVTRIGLQVSFTIPSFNITTTDICNNNLGPIDNTYSNFFLNSTFAPIPTCISNITVFDTNSTYNGEVLIGDSIKIYKYDQTNSRWSKYSTIGVIGTTITCNITTA